MEIIEYNIAKYIDKKNIINLKKFVDNIFKNKYTKTL